MYKILRNFLFLFPAENVHYFAMNLLKGFCRVGIFKRAIYALFGTRKKGLETEFLGLCFQNPVGLGAGFDKNALYLRELQALGFGAVEIGTVTPLPQPGNEKPRLLILDDVGAMF